jgi:hypothetical protein
MAPALFCTAALSIEVFRVSLPSLKPENASGRHECACRGLLTTKMTLNTRPHSEPIVGGEMQSGADLHKHTSIVRLCGISSRIQTIRQGMKACRNDRGILRCFQAVSRACLIRGVRYLVR